MSYINKINSNIDNSISHLRKYSLTFSIGQLRKVLNEDKNNKSFNCYLFRRLKQLEEEGKIIRISKRIWKFRKYQIPTDLNMFN